ncbi:unnamed protein product [Adineta ricciae]|uniref:ER-bound oxygenase mpaB/mpaB'/Rubber oxygenase catalytic domain-containing protein n=1 Tax=Adineta ricciae TaxID=249248 RepID=A0A814SG47_ADIRI|nr:unnamed protein product [Adineta ricciae]
MTLSTFTCFIIFLSIYLCLCRYFRFRRLKSILSKYEHVQLDYRTAQDIVLQSSIFEMPYVMMTALSFALFRTYGIPTIAHLLVQTNQLAHLDTAGRRAEDTVVLLGEFFYHELDSHRGRMGLARMNYLHGLYGNRISNDDMLYTLSLFILEPIRWIEKYEWRSLVSIEKEARFVYYKEVGIRMGIKSIPSTLIELENWANSYEEKNMIYSKDNQICGEATLELMISQFPKCMSRLVRKAHLSFVDERLRSAMGFEQTPDWMKYFINLVMKIRALLLRHCMLPRIYPYDFGQGPSSCPLNEYGRYQRTKYLFQPWYVKETWWNQLFSSNDLKPSPKYRSHGFKIEEIGPERFLGKGVEIMEKNVEKMKKRTIESSENSS